MERLIGKYPSLFMTLSFVFGGGGSVFIKGASVTMTVFVVGAIRFTLQGLFFLSFYKQWQIKQPEKYWRELGINTLFFGIAVIFWFLALERVQAINVQIGYLLVPVMVYIGSIIFLKEPASNRALAGSLVALVGAGLLIGEPIISGSSTADTELLGNSFILIMTVGFSVTIIQAKRLYRYGNHFPMQAVRSLTIGLVFALWSLLRTEWGSLGEASLESWAYLLAFVFIVGIPSNYLFYGSLKYMKAEDSSSLIYVDPLVGFILATVLLGESLTQSGFVASLVVITGVMIAHPVQDKRLLYLRNPHVNHHKGFLHWLFEELQLSKEKIRKLL